MHVRQATPAALLLAVVFAASLSAQEPTPDVTPGAVHTAPRSEPTVEGFVRKDRDAITLALPSGKTLTLHDFDFNGEPVETSKLHLKRLSAGVYELSSLAYDVGYWRFYVSDSASYFGFGEHFDILDRAHTVVHNLSIDNPNAKGSGSYKPIPFYMSTTGYGLWLDTTGDATFDLNATERENLVVDFPSNSPEDIALYRSVRWRERGAGWALPCHSLCVYCSRRACDLAALLGVCALAVAGLSRIGERGV